MVIGNFLYILSVFIGITGYTLSVYISNVIKSSSNKFENNVYEDELRFISSNIFDGIKVTNTVPTIVNTASIYDINDPSYFQQLSSSLFDIQGVSRVGLLSLVEEEDLSKEEDILSDLYNQSISTFRISNYTITGEYAIVKFISPDFLSLIGLIVNSDEDRDKSIKELLNTKNSTFIDNVELQDNSGDGRLIFHPIIRNEEVFEIITLVINYYEFFSKYTYQFHDLFPDISMNIIINEIEVYLYGNSKEIGDKCSSKGFIILCVSELYLDSYIYIYTLLSGIILSTLICAIICILNFLLLKSKLNSKFKSNFIADMSHEIRTPMNGIMGMSELLNELPLGATEKYYVQTIRSCGESLLNIINDILDMSKIEAGNVEINNEEMSFKNIIEETFQNLWVSYRTNNGISRNKLEGKLEIMDNIPNCLIGDPFRIRQIYTNLVTNSMKFTNSGYIQTKISFEDTSKEYGNIQIEVKDTGIGMTRDGVSKAFSPFKQVHSRVDMGGTGLGLSICKNLCSLMNGSIKCESEIGKGTTMSVKIRVGKVETCESYFKKELIYYKNGSIDFTDLNNNGSGSSKSNILDYFSRLDPISENIHPEILVVDDVSINRKLLSKIMSTLGITVDTCDNGIEAVQACNTKKYSYVLMDMVMPVMDGIQACREIRLCDLNKNTPVIFVSANVQSTAIEECKNVGGNGFISKPVTKKKLIDTFIKYSSMGEKEFVRRYTSDNI